MNSNYDARTYSVFGDIGYRVEESDFSFEPFLGVSYIQHKTDRIYETDGVVHREATTKSGIADVGMNIELYTPSMKASDSKVYASFAWNILFKKPDINTPQDIGSGTTKGRVRGTPMASKGFMAGLGVDSNIIGDNVNAQLGYSFSQRAAVGKNRRHSFFAKFTYTF